MIPKEDADIMKPLKAGRIGNNTIALIRNDKHPLIIS